MAKSPETVPLAQLDKDQMKTVSNYRLFHLTNADNHRSGPYK